MAWRRPGDKPLSEPMMVGFTTHICVARPQWVKHWIFHALDTCFGYQGLISCMARKGHVDFLTITGRFNSSSPVALHKCVNQLGQHWFRQWLVTYSAPSHLLNQCWFIVNWGIGNKLIEILIFSFKKYVWKYRLWHGGHFVQWEMSYSILMIDNDKEGQRPKLVAVLSEFFYVTTYLVIESTHHESIYYNTLLLISKSFIYYYHTKKMECSLLGRSIELTTLLTTVSSDMFGVHWIYQS